MRKLNIAVDDGFLLGQVVETASKLISLRFDLICSF